MGTSPAAVAVDLGASSARYATGRLIDGRITFELSRQVPHAPYSRGGSLYWNLRTLMEVTREAVAVAESLGPGTTVGVDAWGVDHGFLDAREGFLLGEPVCYRDLSHEQAMREAQAIWSDLYALTGIQRQPFNTVFQLWARRREDPDLPRQARWLLTADLIGHLLGAGPAYEFTQASTTGLMGLDGNWSEPVFRAIGWPVPDTPPTLPGERAGEIAPGVHWARVGTHDTASAVCGLGVRDSETLFVNAGTWSLVGAIVAHPIVSDASRDGNFTNERAVDGQVRLLKNVPGFYVANRIHAELGLPGTVGEWLSSADLGFPGRVNVMDDAFFNPLSMVELCTEQASYRPETSSQWAALALASVVEATAKVPDELSVVAGCNIRRIRLGGGGSLSPIFAQALANATGLPVEAGPAEATVLGNLAMQFLAQGLLSDYAEVQRVVQSSASPSRYTPVAGQDQG